jgi:hypothetical protein
MSNITDQVHGKFKVFTGNLAADSTLGALGGEVEAWVRSAKVAPKSIGVEYLESSRNLLLSVGYRDDESPYNVRLTAVEVGKLESLDAAGLGKVEQAMAAASAKVKNIICHELYVTETHTLLMVFMAHDAASQLAQ